MALKTTVKVSKVNNLSDARYCAGMGVELIGFVLDKDSPNYTNPEKYKAITEWLEGVEYVGEFYTSSASEINACTQQYAIDYIQITDDKLLAQLDAENIILRFDSVDKLSNFIIQEKVENVVYLLLENSDLKEISATDESIIKEAARMYPLILGCGLNVDNVEKILSSIDLTGISLEGGNEIRPGMADLDELADMLELLEVED